MQIKENQQEESKRNPKEDEIVTEDKQSDSKPVSGNIKKVFEKKSEQQKSKKPKNNKPFEDIQGEVQEELGDLL